MTNDLLRLMWWSIGGGLAVVLIAYLMPGCSTLKQDAAEATYSGQQAECVAEAQSLGQSKKCRAQVDAKWGRTDGGPDGH